MTLAVLGDAGMPESFQIGDGVRGAGMESPIYQAGFLIVYGTGIAREGFEDE